MDDWAVRGLIIRSERDRNEHDPHQSGVSRRSVLAGWAAQSPWWGRRRRRHCSATGRGAGGHDALAARSPGRGATAPDDGRRERIGQLQLVRDPDVAKSFLAKGSLGGVFQHRGRRGLERSATHLVEQTRWASPDLRAGHHPLATPPTSRSRWRKGELDPTVTENGAATAASEARRSGIHWTYAPMMDVSHEPRWGRIAEGNGEDPYW